MAVPSALKGRDASWRDRGENARAGKTESTHGSGAEVWAGTTGGATNLPPVRARGQHTRRRARPLSAGPFSWTRASALGAAAVSSSSSADLPPDGFGFV